MPLSPVWQCRVVLGRAGLGTVHRGDRWSYVWSSWRSRAVPQQGTWQLTSLAQRPRSLGGTPTVTRQDGPPRCQPDRHRVSLFQPPRPAVSPVLLQQIATSQRRESYTMFKSHSNSNANMSTIILSHTHQLSDLQDSFIINAACKWYYRPIFFQHSSLEAESLLWHCWCCGWFYHISFLMRLQLHVPTYWTDRFDG